MQILDSAHHMIEVKSKFLRTEVLLVFFRILFTFPYLKQIIESSLSSLNDNTVVHNLIPLSIHLYDLFPHSGDVVIVSKDSECLGFSQNVKELLSKCTIGI
jgi:hypothetical protein